MPGRMRQRKTSAAAHSQQFPSLCVRHTCWASPPGSRCCRMPRPSSISSRRTSFREAVKSAGLQTRIFASIDLAVSLLTLVTQLLITGQVAQTRRHRHSGGGVAGGLHCRLRRVGRDADTHRRRDRSGRAALDELCDRESRAPTVLHGRNARGKIQGEKSASMSSSIAAPMRCPDGSSTACKAFGLKLGAIALCSLPVVAGWAVLSLALGARAGKAVRATRRRTCHGGQA